MNKRGPYWVVLAGSLALAAQASAQDSIKTSSLQKAMVPKGSVAIARDKQVTVVHTVDSSEPVGVGPRPSPTKPKSSVSRVPIELKATDDKGDLSSVRVVEGKGTIAFEGGAPVLEQKSSGTSVLSSGHAKTIAETSKINTETKTGLPWMVVDVKQDALAGTAPAQTIRTARPFLLLARAVQWLPDNERYVAELIVGLDAEEGSQPGPLEEPFTATLSTSCDEVDPPRVQLARIGPDGDQKVRVSCSPKLRNGKPQQLTVRIASGQLSYPFELPENPGPYALISSATDVPGLGLSTLRLTVSQALEDGSPLALDSDVEVPLQSKTGELHPSVLTIPRGKSEASADVRVFGLGAMSVQAGAGARISPSLEITRSWPVLFLFVTVLGGTLGGYLAIIRQRRGKPEHARERAMFVRRVLEGSLVGLIAVGALLTTPGLAELMPDVARGSQLAWLISAVLAGFLGVELIELLASKLLPKRA